MSNIGSVSVTRQFSTNNENLTLMKPLLFDISNREMDVSGYIPYSSHISDRVIKLLDGSYLATWQIRGVPFETADERKIEMLHQNLNTFLRGLGHNISLWTHRIRRHSHVSLSTENYQSPYVKDLADRYYRSFEGGRMMVNDLFISILFRPPAAIGATNSMLKSRRVRPFKEILALEKEHLSDMQEYINFVDTSLSGHDPKPLKIDPETKTSSLLSFLGFLVNGRWRTYSSENLSPIKNYLGDSRLFFAEERLEIRSPEGSIYGGLLDLKEYASSTHPGILNELMYVSYQYIETQSFSILNKPAALESLKVQRNQLISSGEQAASQIAAIEVAMDSLVDGAFALGEFHYSLAVLGDSPASVDKHLSDARAILNNAGFQPARIDLVADAAWFAQLPGNWKYRSREAKLTSANFSGLSPFYNFMPGKRDRNPWGESVTVLKTPNGAPYYFNWHATDENADSFDDKALGNTIIIGSSGSGKTVTEMFLFMMSMKYNPAAVVFDKDRGCEIPVRALGGIYRTFKRGVRSGLNPLQMENTEANYDYLAKELLPLMAGRKISIREEEAIKIALREIMKSPEKHRTFYNLQQMLPLGSDGGLNATFAKWSGDGDYAWLFDNNADELDLTKSRIFGFDDTDLLNSPDVQNPLTSYLLYRTNELINGQRFMYVMAEFWKRLQSPVFSSFAEDKQLTIRKLNGLGIFDTQSPAQILNTPHVAAMVEQSATQIFLPNEKADAKDYIDGFKLTESEYQIIRGLRADSRCFLVKQFGKSTLVKLDLSALHEDLDLLTTSKDNADLLDRIRMTVGEDPQKWIPVFKEELRARRANGKKGVLQK